ncbi:MAG: DUF2141 domain-containing protein [Fibrobacterales bacterium]
MKHTILISLKIVVLISVHIIYAETFLNTDSTEQQLIVEANGFKHNNGRAVANLYLRKSDIPNKPFKTISNAITGGQSVVAFKGVPYGNCALIVFHDENSNGTPDHNFFGIPSEPMGFSGSYTLSILSGMPTFEKLKFEYNPKTKITITIQE